VELLKFGEDVIVGNFAIQEALMKIIKNSKNIIESSSPKSIAAANAATLLNAASIPFSGRDLSHINISKANMGGAICHYTNFAEAILIGVNFSRAMLANADFSNALMRDVKLGQYAAL